MAYIHTSGRPKNHGNIPYVREGGYVGEPTSRQLPFEQKGLLTQEKHPHIQAYKGHTRNNPHHTTAHRTTTHHHHIQRTHLK